MIRWNAEKQANEICIIEIFSSLNGEGPMSGLPTVFIRTMGCNLRCRYDTQYNDDPKNPLNGLCDTAESFSEQNFKLCYPNKELQWYTAFEIFEKVKELEKDFIYKSVCITGGEPLLDVNKDFMMNELIPCFINPFEKTTEWDVSIETNGSIDYKPYKDMYGNATTYPDGHRTGLSLITDWKFPHSNMTKNMIEENLNILQDTDVIKIVISDNELDWTYLEEFLEKMKKHNCKTPIYLSPMFDRSDLERIWRYSLEHKTTVPIKVQLQIHKLFFSPYAKGV